MSLGDKAVLITGADGFIGSHLTEYLAGRAGKVRALAQYNSFNSWGWLEDIDGLDAIEVVTGDVRDPNFCARITEDIDTVYHLAALIAIPYSYVAPDSYVDTNIRGTLNICQAAMRNGCTRVVHTSTSEVYGTAQYVPINEEHPLQPQSPYSASKIGADALAMSFHNSFELPLSIARPFNTYGPRQSARAIIPTIISQIAAGERDIKVGDVRPTRDFNFVTDTCAALVAIGESEATIGETVNIGSGTEISIGDLFQLIAQEMGQEVEFTVDPARIRPQASEVFRLLCDTSKYERLLGRRQPQTLAAGIRKTIAWFTQPGNLAKYKTGIYNV
ncbi:MAG: NAD-dependent 4,6-dehydratase LegB [Pseudomonadota bacterium]